MESETGLDQPMSQEDNTTSHPVEPTLSADDARVVDALLEAMASGVEQASIAQAVAPGDAERAKKVAAWMALIGQMPAETPPLDLTQRTMERVADVRRREWFAEQAQALSAPRVGMGWNDIGALAAIILIVASLVIPMLGQVRSDARKYACNENLSNAGMAFSRYAADNNDRMPRRETKPGTVWWNVGQPQQKGKVAAGPVESNSAHAYLLVRGGYIAPEGLNCPENQFAPRMMTRDMLDFRRPEDLSYSTQNAYGPQAIRVSTASSMAVAADKNPLFSPRIDRQLGLEYRNDLPANTPSALHAGKGQNILFLGGNVFWSKNPTLPNGDNIWLLNGVKSYKGTEYPTNPYDSFLVP